ncbi:hypothetical protein C8R42DRAFT_753891 [Lentinula raphanica]|nr:hypothetical protein C8R42DRAFT_753891 [Lentinula raphanica]
MPILCKILCSFIYSEHKSRLDLVQVLLLDCLQQEQVVLHQCSTLIKRGHSLFNSRNYEMFPDVNIPLTSWVIPAGLENSNEIEAAVSECHLEDPEHHFRRLALEYDLPIVRIPVHEHNYSRTAKAPVSRSSHIGLAVIENIRLFPEDEVDLRMLYITSAKNIKDKEDRQKEEQRKTELEQPRIIERERERVADDNAYLLKVSIFVAHLASLPMVSFYGEKAFHANFDQLSLSFSGSSRVYGWKTSQETVVKGKFARALEKQRAVEDGELSLEDVVPDEDINMDPNGIFLNLVTHYLPQ